MSAIAVPRARDSLPRPVEAGLEFLRLLAGRPSGLIGFFGIVSYRALPVSDSWLTTTAPDRVALPLRYSSAAGA